MVAHLQHKPPRKNTLCGASILFTHYFFPFVHLQLFALPAMMAAARRDPLNALRPLLPRFLLAMLVEPFFTSRDFYFYVETVFFYSVGWCLDAAARTVESAAMIMRPVMPSPLILALQTILLLPKAFGVGLQVVDLAFMAIIGGGIAGALQGGCEIVAAPFKLVSVVGHLCGGIVGGGFRR